MNKSKFLKKSLAMLLALMLVLAMIPLSASAAEGEFGENPIITVNGVYPDLNEKVYTVEADFAADGTATVALGASAPAGSPKGTEVAFIGQENEYTTGKSVNLEDEATTTDGKTYTLDMELRVPQEKDDKPIVTEYTLVITMVEKVLSNNAAIKQLTGLGDSLAEYEVGADKITITSKFLKPMDYTDLDEDNFVTADPNVFDVVYSRNDKTVTVTAQDKKTVKIYEVEITMRDGLTSFEVPNQIGESDISTNLTNSATTVKLTVPYGTDLTKLVPTFTVSEDVKAVSAWSDNNYEFVNGEDTIDASSKTDPVLKLWNVELPANPDWSQPDRNFGSVFVEVTVAENTAGVLESIQVVDGGQKSNVTEVTGNTVTVEMPKGYDFSKGTNVTLNLVGSKEADVEVLAQPDATKNVTFSAADGTATINDVDISSKEIRIRVSSEADDSEYNDYIITLEAAAAAEAKLENFIVKGDVDDDDVDETYEMDMETLILELPYAAKAMAKNEFKVFTSISTGATATNANTKPVNDGITTLAAFFNSSDESKIIVTASDGTKATYDIKLDYADARTGRTLTSAELVGTTNVAEKTNDNTYGAVPGTAKMGTETVETIRVTVPYSYGKAIDSTNAASKTVFSSLELSEGAVAYIKNGKNISTVKISELDPKGKGPQADATTVTIPTNATNADGSLNANATTIIWVISEEGYVDQLAADGVVKGEQISNLEKAGKATKYYVYGVNMEAQKGASLVSIDSTLDENIDVTMKANNVIEIAVPYSYPGSSTTAKEFSLNFRADSMATVTADIKSNPTVLKSDLGSEDTENATQFIVGTGGNINALDSTGAVIGNFSTITVTSENYDGKQGNKTTYTIQVKVNEAETGSALTSVEAAGSTATIASNRDVNLTLPYGTDKYPVQLDLEASKLATIYVGTPSEPNASMKNDDHLYDPEKGYDLNGDLKILVVAENGEAQQVYTLKTTVAENFFDVANDQWYYDEVLKAASNGWINGTNPGYYEPNGTMTRGDFALIIARIKNYNPALYTESAFPDVESTDYYSAAIAYCKEMGYLGGENGYFNPKDPITREEMAKIICNAAGVEQVTDPTSPYADDDTIAEWAKGYVYGCQAAEIMMGDENANTFDARSNATRAEAAAVLVRAFA